MKRLASSKVFAGVLVALTSGVSNAQPQSPPALKAESNSVEMVTSDRVFQVFGSGTDATNEMRARLADPEQRAKVYEDQRRSIAESHYGVADALQLDAATFDKLIRVLADQQMELSEHFYQMFAGGGPTVNPNERMSNEAERVTRQVDAQREVLGQEKLERYQKLRLSLGQRGQIRQLDDRLDPADKLDGTQRERLVELLEARLTSSMDQHYMLSFQRSPFGMDIRGLPSREELQRFSQLQTISSNEEIWRAMPESNRQLREQAATFLTERQLAVLAQMHAEQETTRRLSIEHMRVQAGLSSTIPEQPEVTEVQPATVERSVRVSLKVTVDSANAKYLTMVVNGGKSLSMKIADNLVLEATPVVFDNDAYNLRVQYFEIGVTGKRLIGNSGQSGMVVQAIEDGRPRHGGGGTSVLTGSKGYAIELSALVEAT